ncbi:dtdp-Glucose 4,6-dehydratase [Arthrobacter sp. Hiyo8]|nr:dtdp-Glucose 4,6-dehydratase [Arthrobacter sp. Hiyo8]
MEITETGDQTSTRFNWTLLMVCGDPAKNSSTYFSGFPADKVSPISCPDNVAFDSAGYMWIATDGAPSSIGYADGLFKVTLDGGERGKVEQFLAVPRDAETCGPIVHDDERTVFVAVQHPGEEGTFDAPTPSSRITWAPEPPRPPARSAPASVDRAGVPQGRLALPLPDAFPTNAPADARSRMWVFRPTLAHVCGSFGRRSLTLFKGVSERLGFWPYR